MRIPSFILCIFIVLLSKPLAAQLTYQQLYIDYDNAWEYKNLRIIPVRPKGLPGKPTAAPKELNNIVSLEEAMKKGYITLQERGSASTENVHWLSFYNNSDKNVFIASGELLEGGRQDRMVTKDTVVLAKSGRIDLPVMCVEEGRWSNKDKKFVYKGMANTQLRKTLDVNKNQVLIWQNINGQLQQDSVPAKTLSYLARTNDKKYLLLQNEYLDFFKKRLAESDSNMVGIVCMSGDKVLGSDIFLTPQLFFNSAEALLLGYIDQAITKGKIPTVTDEVVKKYLDQFLVTDAQQRSFLQKNGKQFFFQKKLIHITSY